MDPIIILHSCMWSLLLLHTCWIIASCAFALACLGATAAACSFAWVLCTAHQMARVISRTPGTVRWKSHGILAIQAFHAARQRKWWWLWSTTTKAEHFDAALRVKWNCYLNGTVTINISNCWRTYGARAVGQKMRIVLPLPCRTKERNKSSVVAGQTDPWHATLSNRNIVDSDRLKRRRCTRRAAARTNAGIGPRTGRDCVQDLAPSGPPGSGLGPGPGSRTTK